MKHQFSSQTQKFKLTCLFENIIMWIFEQPAACLNDDFVLEKYWLDLTLHISNFFVKFLKLCWDDFAYYRVGMADIYTQNMLKVTFSWVELSNKGATKL